MSAETEDNRSSSRTIIISSGQIDSAELLGDQKVLVVIHNNEDYTLRQTSNGKLILTK